MDKGKCTTSTPKKKAKPQAQAQSKSKELAPTKLRREETIFNPDGPDSYDFTEDEIRNIQLKPESNMRVRHIHEWEHLTESCGCVFNKEFTDRTIACDKLLLQDRFLDMERQGKPIPPFEKLSIIAEAIGPREALYPDDDNRKAQLESLWTFAYQIACIEIAKFQRAIVNY